MIGSVYPPLTSLRHEYISRISAPIHYAPPQEILRILERNAKTTRRWPRDLVEQHEGRYGPDGQGRTARPQCLVLCRVLCPQRRGSCARAFRKSCSAHRGFPEGNFRDSVQRHGARAGFYERSRQRRFAARDLRRSGIRRSRNRLQPRLAPPALSQFRGENSPGLQRNRSRTFSGARDEAAHPRRCEHAVVAPYHLPRS